MSFRDSLSKVFPTFFPPRGEFARSSIMTPKKKPVVVRFSLTDQILFTKRLGMILRSGMPIMDGLHMMGEESRTKSSAYIYRSLVIDVSNGQTLSDSLNRFPKIFGDFGINIVKIGERSGTLHQNLEYLASELKRKQTLKRKVVGALVYPAVIVLATIGITVMLTVYIFPKIVPIFESVKADLPMTTRALMTISTFLSNYGLYLVAAIVLLFIAFFALMRLSKPFHLAMDYVLLRLPLFGKLSRLYNLTNIARTMSLLLRSDVRIVESIELVANSTRNLVYRRELMRARDRLIQGQNISSQFKKRHELFPPLMSQMVTIAESTGNLSGTFEFLAGMFEEEIDELTKTLTTLLEPVLMIVMGLVVGFIAISIITPIYSITQSLNP
jgi:type IV pilus assembly protein PilC